MGPENQTQANIDALVFVSAFDDFSSNTSNYMKSIAIPMLDIFAEKDDVRVLSSAQARLVAARFASRLKSDPQHLESSTKVQQLILNKTGNLRYRQIVVPGTDARFITQAETLNKAIRGWLNTHFDVNTIAAEESK